MQSHASRYVPGFVYILVLFIAGKLIFPDPRAILAICALLLAAAVFTQSAAEPSTSRGNSGAGVPVLP